MATTMSIAPTPRAIPRRARGLMKSSRSHALTADQMARTPRKNPIMLTAAAATLALAIGAGTASLIVGTIIAVTLARQAPRRRRLWLAAMGVPRAITAEMVKPGAIVIDVGINRIPDSTKQSGSRLVGDVDYDEVKKIASAITPVPGGVGPMTIAMLLRNTLTAAERQTKR